MPTRRTNDRLLARLIERDGAPAAGWPTHVVPPVRTMLEYTTRRGEQQEQLPGVMFVGLFESAPLRPDDQGLMPRSYLRIAWFEDALAEMFDGHSTEGLRQTPWDQLAEDGDW